MRKSAILAAAVAVVLGMSATPRPAEARGGFFPGFAGGLIAGALFSGIASNAYAYGPGPYYGPYPGPAYYGSYGYYPAYGYRYRPRYYRPAYAYRPFYYSSRPAYYGTPGYVAAPYSAYAYYHRPYRHHWRRHHEFGSAFNFYRGRAWHGHGHPHLRRVHHRGHHR